MTLDEQIEILQAAKEGKVIEYLYQTPDIWRIKKIQELPTFNFQDGTYRIKKQTKKVHLYVIKASNERISQTLHYYANEAEIMDKLPNCTIIKRLDYTELEIDE